MGDRANVNVKGSDDDTGVFLYTHWGGTELPNTLKRALAKKWRWEDDQYLARIIFDEMIGNNKGGETGFGISSYCGDGKSRILVVNIGKQSVSFGDKSWSFTEYIELPENFVVWECGQ